MRHTFGKRPKSRFERRRFAGVLTVGTVLVGMSLAAAPAASARVSETKITQEQAEGQTSAAGINWSASGGCTNRYDASCTSLEQVNQDSVTGVVTLKNASGCDVLITGGTETGHAGGQDPNAGYTHWNGWKLDIATQEGDCIYNYVTNAFASTGTRGDGAPLYESGSGNVYAWEYWANHWDITFYTCGC